jgi:hypothetical protein
MMRYSRASTLAQMICCGVFASSSMAAIAADPPALASNASESAVLNRIQDNWRARGERFKSFYFAWDSRSQIPDKPGEAAAVVHCEYWFKENAGKAQFRIRATTADPQRKRGASAEEWERTFDGTTLRTLDGEDLVGIVGAGGLNRISIDPLLYALRPAVAKVVDLSSNKVRVIGDNAHLDQRRCIKLRQDFGHDFAFQCWVDPACADVVAGWERSWRNAPVQFVGIEYKRENSEWLPVRWTETIDMNPGRASTVSSVTKSAINQKFDDKMFALEFPPGSVVLDKKLKRNDVVQKDGTLKPLSSGALRIYEALEQPVDFTVEPEPLKDALEFCAQRYQIKVTIDREATGKGLIDSSIEVQSRIAGIQLKRVLKVLLNQSPKPLTYKVQNGELLIVPVSRPN